MSGLTPTEISQNHNGKSIKTNSNGGRSKFIWWTLNETLIRKRKKIKRKKYHAPAKPKNHIKDHDGMMEARSAMI